jgi:branched-chain amino acid transport system permease protein
MDVRLSAENLATILAASIALGAFFIFFRRSRWGVAMRATASNQDVAQMMGINVNKISAITWGLAGVVGTVAGISLAMLGFLFVHVGDFALRAFPAAVLGGLDATGGAIAGGAILGVSETLFGGYLGGAYRELMAWIILIAVLIIRPFGLFGTEDIERV